MGKRFNISGRYRRRRPTLLRSRRYSSRWARKCNGTDGDAEAGADAEKTSMEVVFFWLHQMNPAASFSAAVSVWA